MKNLQHDFSTVAALQQARDFTLFTLRHGESEGQLSIDAYKKFGDNAIPLTPIGSAQSVAAGHIIGRVAHDFRLPPLTIHCSKGMRASHTAEEMRRIIAKFHPVELIKDERLDKQKFGLFDGHFSSTERMKHCPEGYKQYVQDLNRLGHFHVRPPQGESIADVQERIAQALDDIKKAGKPAIIVTHGLNALCIENLLMNRGEQWVLEHVDTRGNCAIQLFTDDEKGSYDATMVCEDPLQWKSSALRRTSAVTPKFARTN